MSLLKQVRGPQSLRALKPEQLTELAAEIRDFLVDKVTASGGHLGPNLGVVELTIALHSVFDSPTDRLVWDTGHQSYVHKILTGRADGFDRLRKRGGLSGYPCAAESDHDLVENSHASTALSYADGLARADAHTGRTDRAVVAVIGDGAMTGGMAWEALNNIAADRTNRVVIVVNDNGRSYAPTHGAIATHLAQVRTTRRYEHVLDTVKSTLTRTTLGYVVIRRLVAETTAWASLQACQVTPVECGRRKDLKPEPNTMARYEIPFANHTAPSYDAVVA